LIQAGITLSDIEFSFGDTIILSLIICSNPSINSESEIEVEDHRLALSLTQSGIF